MINRHVYLITSLTVLFSLPLMAALPDKSHDCYLINHWSDVPGNASSPLPPDLKKEQKKRAAKTTIIKEAFTRDNAYLQRYRGRMGRWVRIYRGHTVSRLARRYGVSQKAIFRANQLTRKSRIYAGDYLFIPYNAAQLKKVKKMKPVLIRGKSFIVPTDGFVSSPFGMRTWIRRGRKRRRMHNGTDLAAAHGTPIVAAKSGKIFFAGRMAGYGKTIIIQHAGKLRTLYAHCAKLTVTHGQSVKRGQTIALIGSTGRSTGPHLHWEIRVDNHPVNPAHYVDFDDYSKTAYRRRCATKRSDKGKSAGTGGP